jgi:hypothetical protein
MGYVKTHVTENLEAEQEIEQELNWWIIIKYIEKIVSV